MRTALNQAMAAALLSVALVSPAWAWSDHASLVWPLLRSQPELIHQTVAAEPLDAFLIAEQEGIARTLAAVESWSVATMEHYPPTPEDLRWGTDHAPTAERFFRGDQGQPDAAVSPLRGSLPRACPARAGATGLVRAEFFRGRHLAVGRALLGVAPGEPVSIAEVIASANDEPDFGMDIGLFEDNGTDFGQRYGLVSNPSGTPTWSTALRRRFTWVFTTSTG